MKKLVLALVALAAIVAVATPALAEIKVNGYYRLQGIATNTDDTAVSFDGPGSLEDNAQSLIDQRLRRIGQLAVGNGVDLAQAEQTRFAE